MEIPKEQVLEMLRNRGDQGKAEEAQGQLPETVDTDRDANVLQRLGIDPGDLLGGLGGGGMPKL